MSDNLKVALIGLDTSHTVQFAMRAMDPGCADDQRVQRMQVTACLRFETPFQNAEGLDERQKQLEDWGVAVTEDFDEAVSGCDAIMMTINDPAYHLEYFARIADLGKPVFVDKPLADTKANADKMVKIAREKNVRMLSCSSLRFAPGLAEACKQMPEPAQVNTFGALGVAPAGSSIVWYGVHAFEMLQRAMGLGAKSVHAVESACGVVAVVAYENDRQGVVELSRGAYCYGGSLREKGTAVPFVVDSGRLYVDQLKVVADFLRGGDAPLAMEDALEVTAMLDAAQRSFDSGMPERV